MDCPGVPDVSPHHLRAKFLQSPSLGEGSDKGANRFSVLHQRLHHLLPEVASRAVTTTGASAGLMLPPNAC